VANLEFYNPANSVKDRIGVAIIDAAEQSGELKPGGTIVEATSGNTGIALAFVCAAKGYKLVLTMPESMSVERRRLLKALGAELVLTPADKGMRGALDKAAEIVKERNAFMAMQFSNPANVLIHQQTTAEEIWQDTGGKVDIIVSGVGTGGTITGVARYLKAQNPDVQIVAADPEGSVYSGGSGRPYLVEGVGEDFWPTTYDPSLTDRTVMVSDAESFAAARRVTQEEGLLIGGSCGTAVHAALVVGAELGPDAVVVVLLPDSGGHNLSKIFDDRWMTRYGFLRQEGPTAGDVLAAKDGTIPDLVVITDDTSTRDAFAQMRELGVSQLVVATTTELPLAAKEVSGAVSELPLMDKAFHDPAVLDRPVGDIMEPAPPMLGVGERVTDVVDRLESCTAVLVLDGGHPVGVLTRSDVLTFLADRAPS
jgi:cystathionine beta-synthase